jgi:hypothetical protein
MGFNLVNNQFDNDLTLNYDIYEPFGKFLNWYNALYLSYNSLYKDFKFTSFNIAVESYTTTNKHLSLGTYIDVLPFPSHDYYEPRVDGWMYISPPSTDFSFWLSPDYRKKFVVDVSIYGILTSKYKSSGAEISLEPRYRITDKLSLTYELSYEKILNDVGYVMDSTGADNSTVILFGRRDLQTVTNVLESNFMINSKMSIDLRIRHYWVTAQYYSFYQLRPDGNLDPVNYDQNQNINFNQFNIDLSYIWNFAPGSQISVVWKNAITTLDDEIAPNLFNDLSNTLSSAGSNSFSIRILYYLDALYLKKKKNIPT